MGWTLDNNNKRKNVEQNDFVDVEKKTKNKITMTQKPLTIDVARLEQQLEHVL